MTGREKGRELLAKVAQKVREKVAPDGEALMNLRGQKAVVELARDLTGEHALPGLKLFRDAVDKFRLQRALRNAEITIAWERSIGAVTVRVEHVDAKHELKFTWHADDDSWHRMDGPGELYEEVLGWVTKVFYPEVR